MIVYLDTNVYIGAKYIFDKKKFNALRTMIVDGHVKVLYSSATIGEVKQHMEEDVKHGVKTYNDTVKNAVPFFIDDELYRMPEIEAIDAVEYLKKKLNDFLAMDGVESISLNPLDAEELLDNYFNGIVPFEAKKPYEFKDAIMINAVKNYQKDCGESICIVSNDKGFRKSFENDENFILFEFLGYFIGYCQKELEEQEQLERISNAIDEGELNDVIRQYLEDLDVSRGYYVEWDCEDKTIDDVACELSYIDRDGEKTVAVVEVEVCLSAEIKYRDECTSYYDKEEGRYLIENFITAIEKHKVLLELSVECKFEKDYDGKLEFIDGTVVEDSKFTTIDLDEDTLYDTEEISKQESEEPDLEYCSQCGKVLGWRASNFDYKGNPLCDDCMISDSKGEICPRCGRKIPIDYMASGFCQDCADEE